jgi:hypothetical protein
MTTQTLDLDVDWVAINTIRTLAIDAVQAASSGHPGAPMGLAPVAYTLWQRFLRYNPEQPIRATRDRFVRPRLDAALRAPAPRRSQGVQPGRRDPWRAFRAARRHQSSALRRDPQLKTLV